MFARYEYKAGSLVADVVNDIVALLTGTTDVALLSASCIKENSSIISDVTRPAGWELWDAAAVANGKCIRALNEDGSSYKYVVVYHNNVSGLQLRLYESWNASTHVGTNLAYASDNWSSSVALNNGGALFISASVRGIIMQGYTVGAWDSGPIAVMEHTRDEPWDTPAFGLPPVVHFGRETTNNSAGMNTDFSAFKARSKNGNSGSDVTGSSAMVWVYGPYYERNVPANLFNTSPRNRARDADFNPVHAFAKINVCSYGILFGKLHEIFTTTCGYGSLSDEATYEGKTYFMLGTAGISGCRIAVPKF